MLIGKYGYESGNNMKEVTEKIKETKLDFILKLICEKSLCMLGTLL